MVKKFITQDLAIEYVTHLKGTKLIGVHADVMGMNDSTKGSIYQ